jgi:hypothetical protein
MQCYDSAAVLTDIAISMQKDFLISENTIPARHEVRVGDIPMNRRYLRSLFTSTKDPTKINRSFYKVVYEVLNLHSRSELYNQSICHFNLIHINNWFSPHFKEIGVLLFHL